MFEIGKEYEIVYLDGDTQTTMWGTVERHDHPMLKMADFDPREGNPYAPAGIVSGPIFNVTSPNFVRAIRVRREGK